MCNNHKLLHHDRHTVRIVAHLNSISNDRPPCWTGKPLTILPDRIPFMHVVREWNGSDKNYRQNHWTARELKYNWKLGIQSINLTFYFMKFYVIKQMFVLSLGPYGVSINVMYDGKMCFEMYSLLIRTQYWASILNEPCIYTQHCIEPPTTIQFACDGVTFIAIQLNLFVRWTHTYIFYGVFHSGRQPGRTTHIRRKKTQQKAFELYKYLCSVWKQRNSRCCVYVHLTRGRAL